MSKKRLDTTAITNELSGGSAFFPNYKKKEEETPSPAPELASPEPVQLHEKKERPKSASKLASKHASMKAGTDVFASSDRLVEAIRRIVKSPAKEDVLYVRLTKEEKASLADVTYTYKRQGMKTSDNEVVRVALNALIEEYKVNGARSLLARILESLHA